MTEDETKSLGPETDLPEETFSRLMEALEHPEEERQAAIGHLLEEHPAHAEAIQAWLRAAENVRSDVSAKEPAEMPERIGSYRILQVLGEGGMGTVYLAEQKEPVRRRVALKVIKLGMDSKEVLFRFEAERQALAIMNHDGIAKVFEAGTTERGQAYFVMEHVAGAPITEHCDKHRLTTKERLQLFQQMCAAVQHAHQKGVIHRDLKPSNVLVSVDQGKAVPKIIDFGVARATDHRLTQSTLFTEQGRIIGTPEYMSPEQAEMSSQDIDTRTDIYSLGVILYELLVGQLPFPAVELRRAGLLEIQRKIREDEPPKPSTRITTLGDESKDHAKRRNTSVSTLLRELRGDLDWIVMMAMDKDRNRRYETPLHLAEDINRHLTDSPVRAAAPTVVYLTLKFVRKHRSTIAAGYSAYLLVALLTGLIATAVGDRGLAIALLMTVVYLPPVVISYFFPGGRLRLSVVQGFLLLVVILEALYMPSAVALLGTTAFALLGTIILAIPGASILYICQRPRWFWPK